MTKSQKNEKIPQDFIQNIVEFSAGFLPPESLDNIFELFGAEAVQKHFTGSTWANLLRILSGMYDKVSFLNECIKYPHYVEVLSAIAANSNYLTDILVRNPEYFYWISNLSTLKKKLREIQFKESVLEAISLYKTFGAKVNALRSIKRKEILRIGTRDILGYADLEEITGELSILARLLISELFSLSYREILNKYGIKSIERKFCIIALGKLGGDELNYSSDVDLMIFYDENENIKGGKSYNEILTEAIHLFIKSASSVTPMGFIFRIDFRLRPDGRNSPLTGSLPEYLNYYESRGEDWERQMLIKANFICGNRELYNQFTNFLLPFIYPSTFSSSPVEQIRNLKSNIEKSLKDEGNIKLIPGGIRDIEFSVQALQLINGGKIKDIRTGNTLEGIHRLSEAKLLEQNESDILTKGYIFYRKIEHFLQLMNDTQTHTIPEKGEILEKLSTFLSFKNSAEFKEEVAFNRKAVGKIYNSIMGKNSAALKKVFNYDEINFKNKLKAEKDLDYLREGKGLLGQKQFDKESIDNFKIIEPRLFEYLRTSIQPDQVLQNFVRVIRTANFPSIWYKEFRDKKFFKSFLTICEFSQKAIDLFAEDRELREHLLTRKIFEKIVLHKLYRFSPKKIAFVLAVQLTVKLLDAIQVSKIISQYFEETTDHIINSFNELNEKGSHFFIASMGSLGSHEMTFSSDIDLIFIVDNLELFPDTQKFFQSVLMKLKETLKPFDVDCRLRPEGKSSLLVWELEKYIQYVNGRARTWEFQAFFKLNFIAGNKKLFSKLVRQIINKIKILDHSVVKKDIFEMRKKMYPVSILPSSDRFNIKKGRGGITDIEFIIQYLILCNPKIYNAVKGKGIIKTISILKDDYPDIIVMLSNYTFLKKLEITNQNIFNITQSLLWNDTTKTYILANQMGFSSIHNFNVKLSEVTSLNNSLFQKYLG